MAPNMSRALAVVLGAALLLGCSGANADGDHDASMSTGQDGAKAAVSTVQYAVPAITLVRDDGRRVSLPDEINDGRPVLLNFIFTSCGGICPLMSQMFSQFQAQLGTEADSVHLMSISIDPEQDTPARLKEYAQQYRAGPEWQHYTGSLSASVAAQRAFDVYRGDKMSHAPITLMRAAPGEPWLRIDGFVTPDRLVSEYHKLLASQ